MCSQDAAAGCFALVAHARAHQRFSASCERRCAGEGTTSYLAARECELASGAARDIGAAYRVIGVILLGQIGLVELFALATANGALCVPQKNARDERGGAVDTVRSLSGLAAGWFTVNP